MVLMVAGWFLRKNWATIKPCMTLPRIQSLLKKLGVVEERVVPKSLTTDQAQNQLESLRPGSEETELMPPKSQCLMGGRNLDGDFEVNGCANLMGTDGNWFLMMPEHVWISGQRIWAKGRQSALELSYKRETDDVICLATDFVAVRISPQEMSTIGVSKLGIQHFLSESGASVKIVGCQGLGTVGLLKHDSQIFGRVVYNATTRKGYSGAAYISNNQIVGLHFIGGKVVNGGYSASYLWSLLMYYIRKTSTMRFEEPESNDWIEKQIAEGREFWVDREWGDLDEVRVRVDGRYHIVQRTSMNKALGLGWYDELDYGGRIKQRRKQRHYDNPEDYEALQPSGEVQNSSRLGGLSMQVEPKELDKAVHRVLTNVLKDCSKKKLLEMRELARVSVQGTSSLEN